MVTRVSRPPPAEGSETEALEAGSDHGGGDAGDDDGRTRGGDAGMGSTSSFTLIVLTWKLFFFFQIAVC